MPLLHKEDWEAMQARMRAWWARENFGRCGLAVTAPREGAPDRPPPPRPADPQTCWTDLDYISALRQWEHERTFFGGEAFPVWHGGYPCNKTHAAFLGCRVDLDFHTGWVNPHPALAGEGLDVRGLRIDDDGPAMRLQLAVLRRGVREAKGKSVVGVGAFGGVGDTLAWLRGTERLLLDLADRPDDVRAAELHLMDQWCDLYGRFHALTRDAAEGSTCWFGLWSPGKFYATQNDFAYMISPRMFESIFLPALRKQLDFLDHAIHHVDGEGNFAHVDLLCSLERLHGLQILPGAGKPDPLHYMPVLRKVQAAGKNLHISVPPQRVREALRELSARGLFITTHCRTEAEARELLRKEIGRASCRERVLYTV
mgnify:CR=1 FL=1